ncbi:MAG: hypothetical protein RL197_208 [Actinomycetota bacterium]|jgi:hypothetical protein
MNNKNKPIGRLQIIAGFQLASIIIQLALGIAVLVASSVPEYPEQSVNTYNQIALMLFIVFLVPAIPTLTSAWVLIRPFDKTPATTLVRARKTQLFVFIFCLVTLFPAISLATNGFWVFMVDCILGIISWFLVRQDLKPAQK